MLCFSDKYKQKCERLVFRLELILITLFSYDGLIFHNQADSKNGHYYTTLANIDDAPLAVGGDGPTTKKAEILDISSNTWTEVADYPYHE